MRVILIALLSIFFNKMMYAQSLAINTDGSTAHISALLDVKSTDKGILIPRMTAVQRAAIATPASGLLVFDTDSIAFAYYDGSLWFFLNSSSNIGKAWSTRGNNGTLPTDFIGTIDGQDLFFKINNTHAGVLNNSNQNTSLGYSSNINFGKRNTAFGFKSLSSFSSLTAASNTAIGNAALSSLTNAERNTAVGDSALAFDLTGFANTAVGAFAAKKTLTGGTVAMGRSALENNTTGQTNTAIGYYAMEDHVSGNYNVAIGGFAKRNSKAGSENIAIGYQTSESDTSGNNNIAIGSFALLENRNKSNLIAIGTDALFHNGLGSTLSTESINNIAIGNSALLNNTTGNSNTAVGYLSIASNTTGINNTAVGNWALRTGNGSGNAAFGNAALKSLTGTSSSNVAVGDSAAANLSGGSGNVVVGSFAFKDHTSGNSNTVIGNSTMSAGTGGDFNTAIGQIALYNTSGFFNVAIGGSAGYNNTSGFYNSFLGYSTGSSGTTLSNTTTVGAFAYATAANSMVLGGINGTNGATADTKVGIGVTAPSEKLEIGNGRLRFKGFPGAGSAHGITWTNNAGTTDRAFMGMETDDLFGIFNFGLGSWNVRVHNTSGEVGIFKQPGITNGESRLQVKQSAGASAAQRGISIETAINTNRWDMWVDNNAAPDYNFNYNGVIRGYIQNATGNYVVVSDKRLKKEISLLPPALQQLLQLPVYQFKYLDNNTTDPYSIGFMAQDVQQFYPNATPAKQNEKGEVRLGLNYQVMTALSIKAIQEQQQQIQQLKTENEVLKTALQKINERLAVIEKK